MDGEHGLVNPGHESSEGLVLSLLDAEEGVVGIEASSRALLEMDGGELLPDSDRITSDGLQVHGPLVPIVHLSLQLS